MAEEWRQTLSLYVNQFNQDEVDYATRSSHQIVTDMNYLMHSGERKRRMEEWYRERGAVPLRSETRARIIREIENRKGEIEIEMLLNPSIVYEKGGIRHQEERIEKQRLTLEREGLRWNINKVVQPIAERAPDMRLPRLHGDATAGQSGMPKPYLNRDLFGGTSSRGIVYRREDAVLYADRWWDSYNPEFTVFEADCTNYISQCLFAGGAPINYTGKRESGWWYKGYVGGREAWSYSWAVSNALEHYLTYSNTGLRAEVVDRPEQLTLGDVILYDWDGNGSFQHSTIVTAFDAGGMPLINAHTVPSKHRYWDYKDSYAWTDNTVYRFFHIVDRI